MLPDFLREYVDLTESALQDYIAREPETPVLTEGLRYALGLDSSESVHRGKRLRGALCLLVAEGLGATRDLALPYALSVEILHQFLLVHDDLEDGDRTRRNRPAVWARYGFAHGINIGDFLAAKTYSVLLTSSGNGLCNAKILQLLGLLNNTMLVLGRGQASDLAGENRREMRLSDCESIAIMKTGQCWISALLGGAIIADGSDTIRQSLVSYANATGLAYQIVDDSLDLTPGKGRTQIGSDIREGKRTWLAVATAEQCNHEERKRLYDVLDLPRDETSDKDVNWLIDLYQKYNIIELAAQRTEDLVEQAVDSIAALPQPLRERLTEIARSMAQRKS